MSEETWWTYIVIGAVFDCDDLPGTMTLFTSVRDGGRRVPGLLDFWAHGHDGVVTSTDRPIDSDRRRVNDDFVPMTFQKMRPGHRNEWLVCFDASHVERQRPLRRTCTLSSFRKTDEYKRARSKWWRFVRWARAAGVEVPPTRLWFVIANERGQYL